ncbi:MAG: SpoVA/SpoVAEb family sporulation membrane protein [Bacilli bacterium]
MEQSKYKIVVDSITPKEHIFRNGLVAFISGGLMGIIGQFLISVYSYYLKIPTSQAGIIMIVTLIFFGCLFTAIGFFDKWVHFCRCGLIIPITGFAHAMMSAALEYRKEGLITGIGTNMFKLSGSVIVYGVVSAYIFGLLRYLVFGG